MKRKAFTLSLLALAMLFVSVASAEVRFRKFEVEAVNGRALISWTTAQEVGVSTFKIERSIDGVNFFEIATLAPHGANVKYEHVDSNLFKQSTRTFYYRIKAESITGLDITAPTSVDISFSGIQQTWGSLKAMFR